MEASRNLIVLAMIIGFMVTGAYSSSSSHECVAISSTDLSIGNLSYARMTLIMIIMTIRLVRNGAYSTLE